MAKTRPSMIRGYAQKNPEFQETLEAKALEAQEGDQNLCKTAEEMEEVLGRFDVALGRAEEELATHTEGEKD